MRSSSVLVALATLSGVESRIEDRLERQHIIAPDSPTEVHEYYAPGFGGSATPEATQQQVSSDSKVPNERWFPFGGEGSNYYESGDTKAPAENQGKVTETAARPKSFLQQPSQDVHEYYAPWFGAPEPAQDQVTNTKSSGSETWFPFSAASASFKGDDDAGLPEQGFHGEDVEHKDGKTQTGDWGGEYQHSPEQSKEKASEATAQPPSALLQEPSQEVHEYYAPWFGAPDVPEVHQESDSKEQGNERWFPFAAASAGVFNEDTH